MLGTMNGTTLDNSRNGRISVFDRTSSSRPTLGITPDFELAKSAWNSTSRIWGTGTSFLDDGLDNEPMRPSPIRQTSAGFGQARNTANPMLSPSADPTSENGIHSKMHWSAMSANVGFARQKMQPLSPTKQAHNHGPESLTGLNSNFDSSSLFAGSAPDIEDDRHEVRQSYHTNHRSVTSTSRPVQSPTRTVNGEQYPSEHSLHAANHGRGNDVFGSMQRPESGHYRSTNGSGPVTSVSSPSGVVNGYPQIRQGMPQHSSTISSRYDAVSPTYGKSHGRSMTADRAEPYPTPSGQRVDDAIQSLQSLSFGHAQENAEIGTVRRVSLHQPQYQSNGNPTQPRQLGQSNTQFPTMETAFHTSGSHAQNLGSRLDPLAAPHYAGMPYGGRAAFSPIAGDYRSNLHSPYYSAAGTPPTGPESVRSTPASGVSSRTSHHDQMILDHKLRSLDAYHFDQNSFTFNPGAPQIHNTQQYEMPAQGLAVRLNPHAHPYIGPNYAGLSHYSAAQRLPAREPEQNQVVRSAVLEDFRMNSKTNKRFELKDIYNHVVEFSGDQHGSRFIQQKLETANSDEKEQVFKEIQPNLLQLMTDVFGNYVIQKMFEHGNQSQKKILANQMKGHVWTLSMQMYGCRVVQKAFEYVLTDQQATLVKELDGPNAQILKVVKDQNGNHVIQKAIERIPGEYIQFIVDAHRGQAIKMSTHQYGCRVVQRMLEYCQPKAKRVILDELLENIQPLILDSYGNYVVQHIIQNGEPQDRRFVVNIVLKQILNFSKHKFASNIVEKSIDCADEDQRNEILERLTAPDANGATPVLGLMRDQYGNYVLQKVYARLRDAELAALEADMKQNYPVLRRTSYGKQVIAIEKLLWGGMNSASTGSTSSRNSAQPSTNASSTAESPGTPTHPSEGK